MTKKNLGILFNNLTKKFHNKIVIKFSEEEQYSYLDLDHLSENFIVFFRYNTNKANTTKTSST